MRPPRDSELGIIEEYIRKQGSKGIFNFVNPEKWERQVANWLVKTNYQFVHQQQDSQLCGFIRNIFKGKNMLSKFGGLDNQLSDIGKIFLDNILKGKLTKRKIHKFVRPKLCYVQDSTEVQPPSEPEVEPKIGLDFAAKREKCLKNQTLFEDPEFPANDKSLYFKNPPEDKIVWKRPWQIVENPRLIVGKQSRFDVVQGALGDCWFVAAVAILTMNDTLFYRVVPPDQSFTKDYAGIFHFQFWYYGKWVDVVIDDRLPTVDGELYYMHSKHNNEFWSALLEKAYAKLYGSYEHLKGGLTGEALEDFTGGLTEFFDVRKINKGRLLDAVVRGMEMGSLFACGIDKDPNIKDGKMSNGLICGHAYSVTSVHNVSYRSKHITLLRIRNPWGDSAKWNGAWSDDSPEWKELDPQTKKDMKVKFEADGEFWISLDDFYTTFHDMDCCNLSVDIFDEISSIIEVDVKSNQADKCWLEIFQHGQWSRIMGTAGGCEDYQESYYTNPQFGATVTAPEESVKNDGKVTVIVAVLQKFRREMRSQGKDDLSIGVALYEINDSLARLGADFFTENQPVAITKSSRREVTCRFRVLPGNYVAVPSTANSDEEGKFLLRVYANSSFDFSLL